MLQELMESIADNVIQEEEDAQIEESIENERIRDIYLDANEDDVAGAEDDVDVDRLIKDIPHKASSEDIEKVVESITVGAYPS